MSFWSCLLQKYQTETQITISHIIIKDTGYAFQEKQSTVYSLCCNAHNTLWHDKPFINACNKMNTAEQLHTVAMDF